MSTTHDIQEESPNLRWMKRKAQVLDALVENGGRIVRQAMFTEYVSRQQTEMARLVLESGSADIHGRFYLPAAATGGSIQPPTCFTAVQLAVHVGHLPTLEMLCAMGANVDTCGDATGAEPPLIMAIRKRHTPMVQCLLHYGANLHVRTAYFQDTPLHVAAETGCFAVVKLLVEHGANVMALNAEMMLAADSTRFQEAHHYLCEIQDKRMHGIVTTPDTDVDDDDDATENTDSDLTDSTYTYDTDLEQDLVIRLPISMKM